MATGLCARISFVNSALKIWICYETTWNLKGKKKKKKQKTEKNKKNERQTGKGKNLVLLLLQRISIPVLLYNLLSAVGEQKKEKLVFLLEKEKKKQRTLKCIRKKKRETKEITKKLVAELRWCKYRNTEGKERIPQREIYRYLD